MLSYYIGMHMKVSRLVVELLLLISYSQLELFANPRYKIKRPSMINFIKGRNNLLFLQAEIPGW